MTTPEELNRADRDLLIRLDQKLDSHIAEVRQNNSMLSTADTDHENRLRSLEKAQDEFRGTLRGLRWATTILGLVAAIIEPAITLWVYSRGGK